MLCTVLSPSPVVSNVILVAAARDRYDRDPLRAEKTGEIRLRVARSPGQHSSLPKRYSAVCFEVTCFYTVYWNQIRYCM